MAPAVGFEPTTNRLTADRSTTELRWNVRAPQRGGAYILPLKIEAASSLSALFHWRKLLVCVRRNCVHNAALKIAGWSSLVARQAHNLKAVGSNPTPATNLNGSLTPVCEPFLFIG